MNPREVAAVLAYLGRLDPRTMRTDAGEARDQIAQWHELLGDVPFTTEHGWDVREAIKSHVLASPYPILPVDVARQWRAYRRDRLNRHTDPTPVANPDNPAAWRAELLGTRHAVATGQAAPATHRQLTSGAPHPGLKPYADAVGSYIPAAVRAELAPYRPARAAREAAIAAGGPDVLGVRCQWCHASEGQPCRSRRVGLDDNARGNAPRALPHPSRVDLAEAALAQRAAA